MGTQSAKQLLEKYLQGKCTPDEKAIVESWYNAEIRTADEPPGIVDYQAKESGIYERLPQPVSAKTIAIKWIAASAAVLLLISGIYWMNNVPDDGQKRVMASVYHNDISPGQNKAILSLANGKTISLSDAKSGITIKPEGLVYSDGTAIDNIKLANSEMAVMNIPKGGQYNVELPDGTKVALNSASVLKFPSTFSGSDSRIVELDGEGYFQVARDPGHPFIVKTAGQQVEVLGTHFNINSYDQQAGVSTTLLEGSVKVSAGGRSKTLRPGQQSLITGQTIAIREVDATESIAWTKGLFIFDNEPIESVMRKISRWYDVEIDYPNGIPDDTYLGSVSRFSNVSKVLDVLESTGSIHFKVEGRRISVIK